MYTQQALSHILRVGKTQLEMAYELSENPKKCADYARKVFKNTDNRGKWKKVQGDARRIIFISEHYGLTLDKPYIIVRNTNGWKMTVMIPLLGLGLTPGYYAGSLTMTMEGWQ